jgi:hypothetical protein
MKKLSSVYLILIMFSTFLFADEKSPRQVLKVDLSNHSHETLKKLFQLGLDVTLVNSEDKSINVLVNQAEIQHIKKIGLKSETLIEDADAFAKQLRLSGYLENFHTFDQMFQEMSTLAANHPELVKLQDIGDSYEKTAGIGGYDIWAMKISDNVNIEEDEPEVFYMANMHAREIITPEIIMYFMHYLIDNYGTNGYVTHLVNNRQIWLCPTFNPDGHEYAFTGENSQNSYDHLWWRKNKRDNNDNGIFETGGYGSGYDGVDLNRNFGYKWGDDNGSSGNMYDATYRGTAPFSEPESQAIRDFVIDHNFIINLSFHSHSRLWLYPWGYADLTTPDHDTFVALADSCVAYNGYKSGTGYGLYAVSGDTDDWFYGEQTEKNKIYAFTPEVGNYAESVGGNTGFFPDTMYIEKQILENQGPMLYLTYAAGEEPIIQHTPLFDQELQGPYQVMVRVTSPIILTTPVPLDETTIKLYYSTNSSGPFDSTQMAATGNPDYYTGEIPELGISGNVYYYISATDQIGRTGNSPRGAPLSTHKFHVGEDTEAPIISHQPVTEGSSSSTAFVIRAHVTDNLGINSVKLLYRKNETPLDSLDMTPLSSIQFGFIGIIPAENVVAGDYYEYKIVARDISVNSNTVQMPKTGFYKINIKNSILYDFELQANFSTNEGSDWQWGNPTSGPGSSHSGTQVWATNLSGNYNDETESILETPEISLVNKDSSKLTFWHWYANEYSQNTIWDGGNVKISVDGDTFRLITPEDGYDATMNDYNTFLGNEPCFGGPVGNGDFWQQEVFDLSAYTNHSVKFRFHFASDAYTNELGWYIDDVEILFKDETAVRLGEQQINVKPAKYQLYQNYPNPFNPTTEIKFSLADEGKVSLEIFNMLGQKIKTLVDEHKVTGINSVFWNGKNDLQQNVASGIYLYKLTITGSDHAKQLIKKMVKLQ